MSYISVSHCGNEHQIWLKSMDFYDEELDVLEGRLIEIVKKNNRQEAMAGVEHFQNQFIVQRNNIDELKHSINEHSGRVAADVQTHLGKMENSMIAEHDNLKDRVEVFEKVINELRHEYNIFLSKWM